MKLADKLCLGASPHDTTSSISQFGKTSDLHMICVALMELCWVIVAPRKCQINNQANLQLGSACSFALHGGLKLLRM